MGKVCGVGINDMKGKWYCCLRKAKTEEQKYQARVYQVWRSMLKRCYTDLDKHPTYKGCQVCVRWRKFSNFTRDITKIPNYELWLNNPGKRISLDKDILLKGNKLYHPKLVKFVSMAENNREMLKRNNFKACKIAGKVSSFKRSKAVIGVSIENGSILEFKSISEAERVGGFTVSNIISCCKGRQKYHKGYTWKYKD